MPTGVYERTSEMNDNNSRSKKGKRLSPEHCAAISASRTPEVRSAISRAMKGIPHTPEHNAAVSKAQKGVPKSTETCVAMSKAHKGTHHSPEHCAALVKGQEESGMFDKMRGGNDIVNHHYIYDHSNLSKYTMEMTRSRHTWLHWVMRRSGIIVPYINVEG